MPTTLVQFSFFVSSVFMVHASRREFSLRTTLRLLRPLLLLPLSVRCSVHDHFLPMPINPVRLLHLLPRIRPLNPPG
ncbi:hypothetical protein FPQ18DRAFT_359606 [Pyronema domesticum]|nr:hypothetical protein FPQ18DRAFT_359606 [Pyronema domesticum]